MKHSPLTKLVERSPAYAAYMQLDAAPRGCRGYKLDNNGCPVVRRGEIFCRWRDKSTGRICGAERSNNSNLRKHISACHGVDMQLLRRYDNARRCSKKELGFLDDVYKMLMKGEEYEGKVVDEQEHGTAQDRNEHDLGEQKVVEQDPAAARNEEQEIVDLTEDDAKPVMRSISHSPDLQSSQIHGMPSMDDERQAYNSAMEAEPHLHEQKHSNIINLFGEDDVAVEQAIPDHRAHKRQSILKPPFSVEVGERAAIPAAAAEIFGGEEDDLQHQLNQNRMKRKLMELAMQDADLEYRLQKAKKQKRVG